MQPNHSLPIFQSPPGFFSPDRFLSGLPSSSHPSALSSVLPSPIFGSPTQIQISSLSSSFVSPFSYPNQQQLQSASSSNSFSQFESSQPAQSNRDESSQPTPTFSTSSTASIPDSGADLPDRDDDSPSVGTQSDSSHRSPPSESLNRAFADAMPEIEHGFIMSHRSPPLDVRPSLHLDFEFSKTLIAFFCLMQAKCWVGVSLRMAEPCDESVLYHCSDCCSQFFCRRCLIGLHSSALFGHRLRAWNGIQWTRITLLDLQAKHIIPTPSTSECQSICDCLSTSSTP